MIAYLRDALPVAFRPADVRAELRRWIEDVERALGNVPRIESKTITVIGGATDTPLTLRLVPDAIVVGRVLNAETPGAAVTPPVAVDWIPATGGALLRSFSGLTTGTAYAVTLVAMGSD